MSALDKAVKEFIQVLTEPRKNQTSPYDTQAEVVRVDGNIAWVHIPGGVDETPVKLTMNAQVGDTVQVRVSGGNAWLQGNATSPPTDDTRANEAVSMSEASMQAAENAIQNAIKASEAAGRAEISANKAEEDAGKAKTAADTAFTNLSQVQSVLDVVNWIAQHGTYEKATTFNPNATYYTMTGTVVSEPSDTDKDSQGVLIYYESVNDTYIRTTDTEVDNTKTYYLVTGTPVPQPDAEHISDYYTLAVTDAMADYIQAHLALTNDGLYVMKDGSQWKVQIADNGVYILDPNDNPANSMTKDGNTVGYADQTHVNIDYHSLQQIDKEGSTYFHVSDLRKWDYALTNDTRVRSKKKYYEKVGNEYIEVTPESGDNPSEEGWYEYVQCYYMDEFIIADGNTSSFGAALSVDFEGYCRNISTGDVARQIGNNVFTFDTRPRKFDMISMTYKTVSEGAKALTFGSREESYHIGPYSVALGENIRATGMSSVGEGHNTRATGDYSHAEGDMCTAEGRYSHAEGDSTKARGKGSHAEGLSTYAIGEYSHAEGEGNWARGEDSHTEGYNTQANGDYSHAEGHNSEAHGESSHAEGASYTLAGGTYGHAEGSSSTASGYASHAEGVQTVASASYSHAQNYFTIAGYESQTVMGRYNLNKEDTAFEIGNGIYVTEYDEGGNIISSELKRSNSLDVCWDGNVRMALDTDTASGDDYSINSALTSLNWTDCIVV